MIAWHPSFLAEYDSPWGALHKLAWLNAAQPAALLRDAMGHRTAFVDAAPEKRNFVASAWLRTSTREDSNGESITKLSDIPTFLEKRCGDRVFGRLSTLCVDTDLRVCEACILEGYHCIVHQLRGLRLCPIHAKPLSSRCPNCNGCLPVFGLRNSRGGFLCSHCKSSFLAIDQGLRTVRDEWRMQERKCMAPIFAWIGTFGDKVISFPTRGRIERFRVNGRPANETMEFDDTVVWLLHKIRSFPLPLKLLGVKAAGLHITQRHPPKEFHRIRNGPARDPALLATIHARYKYVAKQVSNDIFTNVVVGHEKCHTDATSLLSIDLLYGAAQLRHDAILCPVAQGAFLWRARIKSFLERIPRIYYTHDLEQFCGTDLEIFRCQLLSSFYYSVHSISRLQAWIGDYHLDNVSRRNIEIGLLLNVETDPWLSLPCVWSGGFRRADRTFFHEVIFRDPTMTKPSVCDNGDAVRCVELEARAFRRRIADFFAQQDREKR